MILMANIFPFISSTWHIPHTPALLSPFLPTRNVLPPSPLCSLCADEDKAVRLCHQRARPPHSGEPATRA
ncbi:uncharacterized [Tachysurus ichikawai]